MLRTGSQILHPSHINIRCRLDAAVISTAIRKLVGGQSAAEHHRGGDTDPTFRDAARPTERRSDFCALPCPMALPIAYDPRSFDTAESLIGS